MSKYFSVLIFLLLSQHLLLGQKVFDSQNLDKKTFELLSRYSKKLQGSGYLEYKLMADVDRDGRNDTIILFGIEAIYHSANGSKQFLGVLLSSKENNRFIVAEVGERGSRIIDTVYVQNHDIVLESRIYSKGDALCCPTIDDTIIYGIKNRHIVEVKKK